MAEHSGEEVQTLGMVPQEHPDFGRMRAVIAKALMEHSPGQFPSLVATARVASLTAAEVIGAGGHFGGSADA